MVRTILALALVSLAGAATYPGQSVCTSSCDNTFSGGDWDTPTDWSVGNTPAAYTNWVTVVTHSVVFDTVSAGYPDATSHSEGEKVRISSTGSSVVKLTIKSTWQSSGRSGER